MSLETSRRELIKLGGAGLATAALPLPALAQPVPGGKCVVAMSAATETVDPHFSRSQAARNVLMHMFETLVGIDERAKPQLQLAERLEVGNEFKNYRFALRQGVPFHSGKEMTASDVKASLERFARVSPEKSRLAGVASITTPDKYTVVVELKSSTPAWIELIKSPASPITIIPEEECDKEPNKAAPISTGPFRFVDWDGSNVANMRRFPDYKANTAYPGRDGYVGRRTPYFDEIAFRVVTEGSARVAGLQTGQFHLVDEIPGQAAKRLQSDGKLRVFDHKNTGMNVIVVNVARPPTDNLLVRQAIQLVLDEEEIMGVATDGLFQLNPSFVYPENEFYPKRAKNLIYNVHDADRAKALLKQSGYKGEELILLTSADIASLKEVGVAAAEQLKSIGLNVRLEVLDWPGATARRTDPKSHNLFSSAYAIQPILGPFQYQRLVSGVDNWSFYKDDSAMEDAWVRLLAAETTDKQADAWWAIEQRLNGQVYQLKMGDRTTKQACDARLRNYAPFDAMRLWDVWMG